MDIYPPGVSNAAELREHYRRVRKRLGAVSQLQPVIKLPQPVFVIPTLDDRITLAVARSRPHVGNALRMAIETAEVWGLTLRDILSSQRDPKSVEARQVAMAICYRLAPMSSVKLGQIFRRDHSSVMRAVDRYSDSIEWILEDNK